MITVSYGDDVLKTTADALAASDIGAHLDKRFAVAIKPNLVVARPASDGATTHPEVVEAIIRFLREFGVSQIKIIESSGVGNSTNRAFKTCGYEELSRKYGVSLVDITGGPCTKLRHGDYDIEVCDEALRTDFLINVPVLKAHCQTRLTCCMKNLKGCIPDREKRRFHSLGIHRPVAALNMLVKTGYNVVDGICGDLSFEEGGSPVTSNRIVAGRDPLTVDSYCAELIGYRPDEIEYITYGHKLGVGEYFTNDTKVNVVNDHKNIGRNNRADRAAERYRGMINEDAACSMCYASLVYALHRLGGTRGGKVSIGQGYKNKKGDGMGIGNCTDCFNAYVPGCPPKATDIIKALS